MVRSSCLGYEKILTARQTFMLKGRDEEAYYEKYNESSKRRSR